MLGLYLDTLIIGHNFYLILSILNKLTWQKGITKFHDEYCVYVETINQKQHQNQTYKNPFQSPELNPRPLAPKADVLTLDH